MSSPPEQIGPYRILERLGAGGMGEVFLAYDERLDRKVAIKRIRPEGGVSADRRERFRREARIAARLSHPSIVHVYDVLAEADTDFIVMEYVEGVNLRQLLRSGPLEVDRAVSIGLDVARGLADAHREGIVHRDLKTENILVTPSGSAKITDFGIAKRILRDGTEESLTQGGFVVGTYRAMSPEQARGEEVDHRSDLFSLGVLLYEMLTGISPFQGENELATVNRIVQHRQRPVREIRPEVPGELSFLVDHLLQKDPLLRPRGAGEVARALAGTAAAPAFSGTGPDTLAEPVRLSRDALTVGTEESGRTAAASPPRLLTIALLLAALAGVIFLSYLAIRPAAAPLYVAVLPTEVQSGNGAGQTGLLTLAVREALIRGLVSLRGVSPKESEDLRGISGSPVDAARAAAADEVVRSRLYCRPERCRITLDRIRGTDGSLLWSQGFDVPTDDLSLVSSAVENQLWRGYSERDPREGSAGLQASGRDLEELLRLRLKFREEASLDALLDQLEALRRRSPRFLDVYLFEADVARRRFWDSRDPADLERGFSLIREARRLAPENPQPLFSLIDLALAAQDVKLAEETLDELQTLLPGDVRLLERRARILSARGQSREALAQLREAAELQPSAKLLHNLAQMEFTQGEIAAARHHLDLLLQRSPTDFDGLSLLATIEMMSGDLTRAIDLYRRLVSRSPGRTELSNLGLSYFLAGRSAEAADVFERLLRQEPKNPFYTLNLADAYLLAGRPRDAGAVYEQVLALLAADPSASNAQSLTVKAQALAHLGRRREAVAALQEALRLAPEDGLTAYEAALVYALLGEHESALFNAERAVEAGFNERWFSFPWFESLRSRREFRELMEKARSAPP
jgi:tetratricopeptide (TPR) repeat protein/predicted Ser/Thr protein kinase